MRRFVRGLREAALLTLIGVTIGVVLAILSPGRSAFPATRPLVSAVTMAKAQRVSMCEEGGNWHYYVKGGDYAGGVGFRLATWTAFRYRTFPMRMDHATPQQQAWALSHMLGYYHMAWPDQHGCTGSY
jgi:Transglycosylase-like domain